MKFFLVILFLSQASLARPIRGTYEVPVNSPKLKAFAKFPVKFESTNYDGGFEQLTFPLPEELTGVPLEISMEKNPGSSKWIGPQVEADCSKEGRYFVCQMRFKNLPYNSAGVKNLMEAKFPGDQTSQELGQNVAEFFGGEPVGILRYKLRGRED